MWREIKEGQQYYRVDGASTVWQVHLIFGDPSGIRHARLFNVAEPRDFKTLTCSVLRDGSRYRLLSESPRPGAADCAPRPR